MTAPNAPSALVAALLAARKAISPTVRKAGNNSHQNYKFVGHEHVLVAGGARKVLLAHDLVLLLESTEFAGADGGGKVLRWRGRFALLHVPSGEERTLVYEATTGSNDKSGFVAATALDRTAHMRVLELAGSDQENPEHDSHEPKAARERKGRDEGRPLAQQSAPASSPTSANGSRDRQTSAPRSGGRSWPSSKARPMPANAEQWRIAHKAVSEQVAQDTGGSPGPLDEYGLNIPTLPVPSFSDTAKQHAGQRYDAVPGGYLREVFWKSDKFWASASAPQKVHVSYLVARHELAKLEQAAAEKALGAGGAA